MRDTLPIYQSTEACNGLSPEEQHGRIEVRALVHRGGEED
jgi:hypothetical protein